MFPEEPLPPLAEPVDLLRRRLRIARWAVPLVVFSAIWAGSRLVVQRVGPSSLPLCHVFWTMAIGGSLAFTIAASVCIGSRKSAGRLDLVRIGCWTMIGMAIAGRNFTGSYYDYGAGVRTTKSVARVAIWGSLFTIGGSLVIGSRRATTAISPAGYCRKCGYDLRGLAERCPECGTPFRRSRNVSGRSEGDAGDDDGTT